MRVERRSPQIIDFRNRFSLTHWTAALLFIFLNSCTNITSNKNRIPSGSVDLVSPVTNVSGNFTITQVVPDPNSPGTLYNLIGQNDELDTFCAEGTECKCEYTYTQPGVGIQTEETIVVYREANLVRCSASVVPAGISTFDVRVLSYESDATVPAYTSNTISVNLASNGAFTGSTNYIDLTNASAYVMVQRFQCRKREFIPSPLDTGMIDPLQSVDPNLIYTFNYYTTNVGDSLLSLQKSGGNQSWDCTLNATLDRSMHWWANPNVYSTTPCTDTFCSGDQELMYPQTTLVSGIVPVNNLAMTGRTRGSFFLSSQSYGVFQTPVVAPVAPVGYTNSSYGVIGYAAKPIPNSSGSSSCPNITIPSNARWVKVWNFRATDITPPKVVRSTYSSTLAGIACYPAETGGNMFPSCDYFDRELGASTPTSMEIIADNEFSPLLSGRIALLGSAGNAHSCHKINTSGAGSWADGLETWQPSAFKFYNSQISVTDMVGLPWNTYQNAALSNACGGAGPNTPEWLHVGACNTGPPYNGITGIYATPMDTRLTSAPLTPENYSDHLFIVTDTGVDDNAMRNQSSSVSYFRPVTYRSAQACPGPSRAGCGSGSEIHWDINVKAVNAPTGVDVYPLCALQFTD